MRSCTQRILFIMFYVLVMAVFLCFSLFCMMKNTHLFNGKFCVFLFCLCWLSSAAAHILCTPTMRAHLAASGFVNNSRPIAAAEDICLFVFFFVWYSHVAHTQTNINTQIALGPASQTNNQHINYKIIIISLHSFYAITVEFQFMDESVRCSL